MSTPSFNEIRIGQVRSELVRFSHDLGQWFARRHRLDRRRQYSSQLTLLHGVLSGATTQLHRALQPLSVNEKRASVYAQCRRLEEQIVWARRLWEFYRRKFDQRDDAELGLVLAAADEVVWSCYAEAFRTLDRPSPGAAPLPYIEPYFSPRAIPRAELPAELKSDVEAEFLAQCLKQLPIPLVGLPPTCVAGPWWLVFLGHEIGHHLQFDLLPDWQLVADFGAELKAAALGGPPSGVPESEAERWQSWGEEIFADAFSLHALGPGAAWAMGELELTDDAAMLRDRLGATTAYPAPAVRLALMGAVAAALGGANATVDESLDAFSLLAGPPVVEKGRDLRAQMATDLALVPRLAAAIVRAPVTNGKTLAELCVFRAEDFAPHGTVEQWKAALLGETPLNADPTLRAARLVLSGALAGWREIARLPGEAERAAAAAQLRERMLQVIPDCAEPGLRAAAPAPEQDVDAQGARLAELLAQAPPM